MPKNMQISLVWLISILTLKTTGTFLSNIVFLPKKMELHGKHFAGMCQAALVTLLGKL